MQRLVWMVILALLATACGDSGSQKVSGSNAVTSALKPAAKPQRIVGTMSCTPGIVGGAQVTFRDATQGQIRHFDVYCSKKDPVPLSVGLPSPTKNGDTIPDGTVDITVGIFLYDTYPGGVLLGNCTPTAVLPSALPTTVTCNGTGGVSGSVKLTLK